MADNKKMLLNLFSGMQDALFLGDRFVNGEFVSFLQPGQFISQSLQEGSGTNDMAIQADIANILVDTSFVNKYKDIDYSTGTELVGSVDQVYKDVINLAALPYKKMSAETEREIDALRTWIGNNRANYEIYRDQYYDVVNAFETEASKQAPDQGILRRLAQKKTDTFQNWETFGNKKLHDLKTGRFVSLTAPDPSAYWASLGVRFQDNIKTSPRYGDYLQTFLVPSVSSWGSASWASFERQISEKDTYEHSKSTSWSVGASGRWGLWSAGGGASGSSRYEHSKSTIESVLLKFEYLRVRIFRPWLVSDVFNYKFWTWRNDVGGSFLSDGGNLGIDPPVRPVGRMPVLPQYLIVVRNVELSTSFSDYEREFYHREMQAKASVGWGPFSLKGSYRQSETTTQVEASFDGITIKIQQPQIIARTGILLKQSPSPTRALPWGDNACFPGDPCFSNALKEIEAIRQEDDLLMIDAERSIELHKEALARMEEWVEKQHTSS